MPLVANRSWIYPADNAGRFRTARRWVGWFLLLFFVSVPWIRISGLPAALIDIPGRRLVLVGTIFTPHDTWALALLLLTAALGLFLFTSVMGRVWCGWACPQTVWLEWVYRPVERLFEGPAHRKRRRDRGEHDLGWWARRIGKWTAFVVLTALTTGVFMSWFVGGPALLRGEIGSTGMLVGGLIFVLFLLDAVWFREQLCHYACPYARFQGVLMDANSLIVAYDAHRGEPREKGKARSEDSGDCIECNRCVEVCPSGVDIRDGDQLQCIACAGCVDACNEVMVRIGKPQNLIRYTTRRDAPAQAGEGRPVFTRRTAVYVGFFLIVGAGLVFGLATRDEVAVQIARVADGELYRELPSGEILNQYAIHVTNKDTTEHSFTIASASDGVTVTVPGLPWTIAFGSEQRFQAFVQAPSAAFSAGRLPFAVLVEREDGVRSTIEAVMLGPGAFTSSDGQAAQESP